LPHRAPRVDRKALRQDPLLNFTSRAMEYVSTHATLVLGVAAGAAALVVLITLWSHGRQEKTSTADMRASSVVAAFSAGQFDTALQMADAILSSHPGTRGAVIASYIKGKAQLQLGKAAEAEQSFRSYLAASGKAPFFETAAQQALAATLETEGRYAEAAEMYQTLAAKLEEPLAVDARLDAARAYRLAGSTDRAKALLQELQEKESATSRRVRIELAIMEAAPAGASAASIPATFTPTAAASIDTTRTPTQPPTP
jgi:tetratricopeptide (TPR) repeat protein